MQMKKIMNCKQRTAKNECAMLQKDIQERIIQSQSNTKSKLGYQRILLTLLNREILNAPTGIIQKKDLDSLESNKILRFNVEKL